MEIVASGMFLLTFFFLVERHLDPSNTWVLAYDPRGTQLSPKKLVATKLVVFLKIAQFDSSRAKKMRILCFR